MHDVSGPWWGLILLGAAGGILGGTLGLGAGTLFIPVLVLCFSLSQKSAQGIALAVMVPMALFGALRYWMNPDVKMNVTVTAIVATGALIGMLGGSELAARLPDSILRRIFAVYLLIVGAYMLAMRAPPSSRNQDLDHQNEDIAHVQKGQHHDR